MSEAPDFWNQPEEAQRLMQERNKLDASIAACLGIENELNEYIELAALSLEENDTEVFEEIAQSLSELADRARDLELQALLSGEADGNDTYLEIHAGAGGTESQDWAQMLLRMYLRWAEAQGYKSEVLETTAGEEAGLKSATISIKGENAYGWLKTESGVHRLVRISPFDSNARRHTSFSSVWVYPVVDDNIDIDVQEKDVRIDTYRASGAGGQHVNTTDLRCELPI